MAEDLKGWSRPEEKFPEAELEDSFAEYFAEDHASVPGKKQRHRAGSEPDLLVETASEDDPGFVIEGLAAVEQSGATAESQEPDAEAESESEEEPEGPIPETVPACEVPEAENLPDEPFIEEEPGPSGETLSAQAAKSEEQPPEEPSAKEPAAEEPSAEESTEEVPTEEEPAAEEPSEEEAEKPETPVVSPAAKPKGHEIIKMTQNLLWNRRKHRWAAPVGLVVIILAYVVLGMFMDGLAMLVVTVPIVYPIMMSFGFDPIWFGVVVVIVIEMGMISPPVGMNVFVVRGVAGDVPLTTIFRGVFPFLLAMIAALALIIVFPQIALFLPNSMFGS